MDQERRTNRGGTAVRNRPAPKKKRFGRKEAPKRTERRSVASAQRRALEEETRQERRSVVAAQRKAQPEQEQERRRSIRRPEPLPEEIPEVVFTPPRPFQPMRFALELVTMVAVVLALVFGLSLFFRAQVVTVSGAEKYTPWTVLEASGIQMGDSLFPLNEARISGRIISNLPYVSDVRVGIRLPDTVMIQVEELSVSYAVEARDGSWWLMSADGRLVDEITPGQAQDYTRIRGVQLTLPVVGEQAVAAEAAQTVIGEEIVITASTGAQRLQIAEDIMQAMEQAGFLGEMDSVDVTDPSNLAVWSGEERFQLQLGDKSRLEYKMSCARSAMEQLAAYESGILDISLSGEDKVIFTPAA